MTLTRKSPMQSPSGEVDVATTVARLREVYAGGRTRNADWRIHQIQGIERFLEERETEIVAALAEDLGRNAIDAWLADIALVRAETAYARKRVRWRPHSLPLNQLPAAGWVQYEPLGVVLVIGAWTIQST